MLNLKIKKKNLNISYIKIMYEVKFVYSDILIILYYINLDEYLIIFTYLPLEITDLLT